MQGYHTLQNIGETGAGGGGGGGKMAMGVQWQCGWGGGVKMAYHAHTHLIFSPPPHLALGETSLPTPKGRKPGNYNNPRQSRATTTDPNNNDMKTHSLHLVEPLQTLTSCRPVLRELRTLPPKWSVPRQWWTPVTLPPCPAAQMTQLSGQQWISMLWTKDTYIKTNHVPYTTDCQEITVTVCYAFNPLVNKIIGTWQIGNSEHGIWMVLKLLCLTENSSAVCRPGIKTKRPVMVLHAIWERDLAGGESGEGGVGAWGSRERGWGWGERSKANGMQSE